MQHTGTINTVLYKIDLYKVELLNVRKGRERGWEGASEKGRKKE